MKSIHLPVAWLLLTLVPATSPAMFIFPESAEVPIERLVADLERQATSGTNRVLYTYWLARVHSLAYAIQAETLEASKKDFVPRVGLPDSDLGRPTEVTIPASAEARATAQAHLTNAVHQYENAIRLLRKERENERHRWIVLPLHLGYAWSLEQCGERERALDAYRGTLAIAWEIEVVGEFIWKDWLSQRWEDIKAKRNPIHAHRKQRIDARPCFTDESFRCLFRLLDPVKDKKEIAELKAQEAELKSIPRSFWISPILVPLAPDCEFGDLVDPDARVQFNLDGLYPDRQWGWITPKAAWLVYDHTGRGEITSGRQLFGNFTFWIFWENGYQALRALDDNDDGFLEGTELTGLSLWHDANSNGQSEPGEVKPLAAWGIEAVSVGSRAHPQGFPWNPEGVRFHDGEQRPTYDWIVPSHPETRGKPALELQ